MRNLSILSISLIQYKYLVSLVKVCDFKISNYKRIVLTTTKNELDILEYS